jgi:Cache domain
MMCKKKLMILSCTVIMVIATFSPLLINNGFPDLFHQVIAQKIIEKNSSNNKSVQTQKIQSAAVINKILLAKLLANNLENRLNKSAAILEITSKLPEVRKVSFASSINTTLHGIAKDTDLAKRKVAQDILSKYNDFGVVFFIMPNGDMYMEEPYSRQLNLTKTNFAFRDYYKGAVSTHNTYLGNVVISASSGLSQANIAVPIYSFENNSNNPSLVGVWVGGLDLKVFNKLLRSLNLTDNERIVYVDEHGQKIADSDKKQSINQNETFANFQSFKNAIAGNSGSTVELMNSKKTLIVYSPLKFHSTSWAVLLIQS